MSKMLDALKRIEARSQRQDGDIVTACPQPTDEEVTADLSSEETPRECESEEPPRLPETDSGRGEEDESVAEKEPTAATRVVEGIDLATVALENVAATRVTEPPPVAWPRLPIGPYGRACRRVAGNLCSGEAADRRAAWLFTSSDGALETAKTVISLGGLLADAISGSVLVVDGNLHEPVMSDRLRVEASQGLTDVLGGLLSWRQVVRKTTVSGLDLLPGIEGKQQPTDLPRIKQLLAEFRSFYAITLVAMSSPTSDEVTSTAHFFDGTYLLLTVNKTPRRTIRRDVKCISRHGGRLLGSIVVE